MSRIAWLAAFVVASFLSFPHPLGDGVLDLGAFVCWLGPALLILGLRGLPPRRALRSGFLAGWAAYTAIFHWIYVVTVTYGQAPPVVGVLAPLALAAYIAAFPALFAFGWAHLGERRLADPFAAALLWTALDHLRSFALSGFPWATLGYAQHQNEALVALAPYTAVYGLSFVTVLGGAAAAMAVLDVRSRRVPRPAVWLALLGVAVAHGAGFALVDREDESSLPSVRLAVIQGNIDQGVKWSPEWVDRTLVTYEDLSRRAAKEGAQLIVWPETAVPGSLDVDAELRGRLADLARETGAQLVVGAVGLAFGSGPRPSGYFDSAFLIDSAGEFNGRYDKSHLVPFGEYIPFRDLIGGLVKAVARGISPVGVAAGTGPRAVPVSLDPELGGGGRVLPAGTVICYELLFPDLVRRFVGDGAQVLLAITNDAWYGRTGAPYQFLAITAMRSAENRVWTARAANTGISAIIDSRGRVRAQTGIFQPGWLVADVPLRAAPRGGSFYTRHGDVFAAACWIGIAVLGFIGWRRPASRETESGGKGDGRDADDR